MSFFIETLLHIDVYLGNIIETYHTWAYVVLFLIIVCETGLVVTPFLPGDSLLFAAGAFAHMGVLDITILFPIIFLAAIIGDAMNYHIGKYIGPRVFKYEQSKLFHPRHVQRAQLFYETYGNKTIILARFVPIMRTFAPFVAGIGRMHYVRFLLYNAIGALLWSTLFVVGGFFFGAIPVVQKNFSVVIVGIVFISCLPVIKEIIYPYVKSKTPPRAPTSNV